MPFFYINHNKFFSPFSAFAWAAANTPDMRPTFNCFDEEFSKFDWTKEPEASWESLLEARALQLREKYDYIVFFLSGGTDSRTMFRIFKKLNIHIDEIVTTYHKLRNQGYSEKALQWVKDSMYDPTTRLTFMCRDKVPEDYPTIASDHMVDSDAYYRELPIVGSVDTAKIIRDTPRFKNAKSCILLGLEKPLVQFKNGRWSTTHMNKVFSPWMKFDEHEMFYITPDMPELHIKQTHMLKRYAKQFIAPTSDWDSDIWTAEKIENQFTLARWLGLEPDAIFENAINQRKFWRENHMNIAAMLDPSIAKSTDDLPSSAMILPDFEHKLTRYLEGFKLIQTDKTIIDYMVRMGFLNSPTHSIDRYNGMYSKSYDLGA